MVVTFGEILMRLSPSNNLRFEQASNFDVVFGGAEFNVAAGLSKYGLDTQLVTTIPDNIVADCAMKTIKNFEVGSDHIKRQGDRLGIYFLENGVATRNAKVVYDRAHSSISKVTKETFDWETIFEKATWFHWSGITPALSLSAAETCLEAIQVASKMGLTISTDLNYRSKLWKYGKEPKEIMPKLLAYSDVILGDIDTAFFMLGQEKVSPDYTNDSETKAYFKKVQELLPRARIIAMTLRNTINASHQKIGGLLYKNDTLLRARIHEITNVVDRVGTGDAFMTGLLYGLLKFSDDMEKAISFATASCALKHTIFGDLNRVTENEVIELMDHKEDMMKVDR